VCRVIVLLKGSAEAQKTTHLHEKEGKSKLESEPIKAEKGSLVPLGQEEEDWNGEKGDHTMALYPGKTHLPNSNPGRYQAARTEATAEGSNGTKGGTVIVRSPEYNQRA